MYVVILHEKSGVVDVKAIADLQRESLALVRSGAEPKWYAVLHVADGMPAAMNRAAELRKEMRTANDGTQRGLDAEATNATETRTSHSLE